nr:hypothetical protein [uncultured Lachnoclostridium sp.]
MLTVGEWVVRVHEITDQLESEASKKLNAEVKRAQAYHEGYVQACEDFGKIMRANISENQG